MSKGTFTQRTNPERIQELIDFSGGLDEYKSLATLQSRGVAALHNRLCESGRRFAYLADEVGMGKTYQALGVAAALWATKPEARIVFISPRQNLQTKWERDFDNFFRDNFRGGDGIGCSRVYGQPAVNKSHSENLREFAVELQMPGRHAFFLRMTSFARPIAVGSQAPWEESWEVATRQMRRLGFTAEMIPSPRAPRGAQEASPVINVAFGEALRGLLEAITKEEGAPAIDLIVLDEAQSLRHRENQTNTVLQAVLGDGAERARVVDRWLFLSATPVHGGRHDIRNAVTLANPGFTRLDGDPDERRFREAVKSFMVRRPRTYEADRASEPVTVTKVDYRDHRIDDEQWLVRQMDTEAALAMAVVQKKLVEVLEGRSNTFKIGYLSSFESLHDSLRRHLAKPETHSEEEGEGAAAETLSDHESLDQAPRVEPDDEPPDAAFVQRLSGEYLEKFDRNLPHAKLDRVAARISEDACENGIKYLVFTRRINTTEELVQRFEEAHDASVTRRIDEHWKQTLNWENGLDRALEPSDEEEDTDAYTEIESAEGDAIGAGVATAEEEDGEVPAKGADHGSAQRRHRSGLRTALAKDAWLGNYRKTFRAKQRNTLVFQENWFLRLCEIGRVAPRGVASAIPEDLWRESDAFARRGEGGAARRFQYLVTQLVARHPDLLGLDDATARKWREFLEGIYPNARGRRNAGTAGDASGRRTEDLLLYRGFWEQWRERFSDPKWGEGARRIATWLEGDLEHLARRQCVTNWIGQSLRLSDALLDLYCAELQREPDAKRFDYEWLSAFFGYLAGDHPHAQALRKRCFDWAEHVDVIIKNCFDPGRSMLHLASRGVYKELNEPMVAVRVVGGSPQPQAVKQFKMPYYPLIVVCTDVLKEGEDLHVFCDRVVHYGVAWTSGDLEQRVGRVDRFFSQIERRLAESRDATLPVFYPHVFGSIERRQVLTVRSRVRAAEYLMGDLQNAVKENKEINVTAPPEADLCSDASAAAGRKNHPFDVQEIDFEARAPSLVEPTAKAGSTWTPEALHDLVERSLERCGGRFEHVPGEKTKQRGALHDLVWDASRGPVELKWDFIPELGCYALTARGESRAESELALPGLGDETFGAYYESDREGLRQRRRIDRLVLPLEATESEHLAALGAFFKYVEEPRVNPCSDVARIERVRKALLRVEGASKDVRVTGNKVAVRYNVLSSRSQRLFAYVYDEMVLLSSIACRLNARLIERLTGGRRKRQRTIEEWIAEQNAGLRLGFLHHHRPGTPDAALCLCERVFHADLGAETFRAMIRNLVLKADGLEVYLGEGQDVE